MTGLFLRPDSRFASIRLLALFMLLAVSAAALAAVVLGALAWLVLDRDTDSASMVSAGAGIAGFLLICAGAIRGMRESGMGAEPILQRLGALPLIEDDPLHADLGRVAEETAIAAGIPVPMLYCLPTPSINAFTLGDSPSTAALVVTRGALAQLDAEELRGLVAHELAHVFRGDHATNMRLAALLQGFLWPPTLWRVVRFAPLTARYRFAPIVSVARHGPLLPLALPWIRLAWICVHAGREYGADALAIRLTGDRDGLGRVLRRVRGELRSALPGAPIAIGVEHFLFVPSRLRWGARRIDRHVDERIRRLYGHSMPPIDPVERLSLPAAAAAPRAVAADAGGALADALPDCSVLAYRETAPGAPQRRLVVHGLSWFSSQLAADFGCTDARAAGQLEILIGCTRGPAFGDEVAGHWLGLLAAGVADHTGGESRFVASRSKLAVSVPDDAVSAALDWILSTGGASWRMPLFELLLARTRGWSSDRRRRLLESCRRAVADRARDNPSAWVYYTLAQHRLSVGHRDPALARRVLASRRDQSRALAILFAMASTLGEASARNTRDALADAAALLIISPPAATPERVGATELVRALEILSALPALSKPILLKLLGRLARSPDDPVYQAFLRAVAAAVDCPAPRLLRARKSGSARIAETHGA